MVCSADDLLGWKDFPKGLRVLLLDNDAISATETKSKLEEMDYVVSTFCNENEALAAISNKSETFHVAIVEVSTSNDYGSFRFLESARDLPIIMASNIHCLSTTMKCIALGAVELIQKPLSEDKLRNIWQHVVHKAFNAGESVLSKSLKPIKEATVTAEIEDQIMSVAECAAPNHECEHRESLVSDKFPAPLTPQLEQGGRLLGDGDCKDTQHQHYCSIQEARDNDGESIELRKLSFSDSKFVENTCNNSIGAAYLRENSPSIRSGDAVVKDEMDSAGDSKTDECNATKKNIVASHRKIRDNVRSCREDENQMKASLLPDSPASRSNRKKMKVDWTPTLHRRFVQVVEQLGIDQAIPSRILELMQVEGLTRHNVASHLQKYRMHRRPIMPKEDNGKWALQIDPLQRGFAHKPAIAFPSFHSSYGLSGTQYPVWGHPCRLPSTIQMWDHTNFPTWQPPENCVWTTYPEMHANAWSCPVVPPQDTCAIYPRVLSGYQGSDVVEDCNKVYSNSFDLHPAEEVIDKLVKEAISKPWLPLPLGLKPPSTESVLKELYKHGISKIPPHSHR